MTQVREAPLMSPENSKEGRHAAPPYIDQPPLYDQLVPGADVKRDSDILPASIGTGRLLVEHKTQPPSAASALAARAVGAAVTPSALRNSYQAQHPGYSLSAYPPDHGTRSHRSAL